MLFDELRLSKPLLRAIHATGYDTPTPIQAKSIPLILEGRDVLGCAQTGTGKTAAFALPMLERLLPSEKDRAREADVKAALQDGKRRRRPKPTRVIRGLVLCPTRELAMQIEESFRTYGKHAGLRTALIFGGVNQNRQVRALEQGVDIVIATPGRLLDLLGQHVLGLEQVEMLVLDEADRMLDMGFVPDIRRILQHVPEQRQSLLFSATMPKPIRELADEILTNPVSVKVARVSSVAETVEQWVYQVEKDDRAALLRYLLEDSKERTLVFTRTKHGADKLIRVLGKTGISAVALHSNKTQSQRTRAMASFRSGETTVLVATDIAARGLDVDDVSLVVNYDLTPDPETYVHRIGRTGRAGAKGMAISFCMPDQRRDLQAIEKLTRTKIEVAALPALPKPKKKPVSGKPDPSKAVAGKPPAKKATNPKPKSKPKHSNKANAKPGTSGNAAAKPARKAAKPARKAAKPARDHRGNKKNSEARASDNKPNPKAGKHVKRGAGSRKKTTKRRGNTGPSSRKRSRS